MFKYVLKRIGVGILTLFILATVTFFLMKIIPGSPFAGENTKIPASVQEKLMAKYNLDKPVLEQYVIYMKSAVQGDFGVATFRKGRSVNEIIAIGMPVTAKLGFVSFVIAMVVGITLGTVAAFTKHKWVDNLVIAIATAGVSIPGFLLALLLMIVFGVWLHMFPIVGLSSWKHYVLPAVSLALSPIAMIARLTRSSMMEVMRQDYMVLARSKGSSQLKVIVKHGLKNAMIPVITYAGPLIATLMTGSCVIESLFSVPGIGAEYVTSISNRDYTMIMGLTIFFGAFIIIANIITDILNAVVDPRIKLDS